MKTGTNENRAADRAAMAAEFARVCEAAGATVTREESFGARDIRLKVRVPGGAYLPHDFDGDSCQPGVYVLCWNVEHDSLFSFSGAMPDVNPFHFRKASRVCYSFADLCSSGARDIETLISGRGYSSERALKTATERRERLLNSREYIAPIVEAGMGSTYQDGTQCETPEQVRAAFDRIPLIVAKLDSFIAAGAPVGDCSPIAWH